MLKSDKLAYLQQLLSKLRVNNRMKEDISTKGQIIQLLKTMSHFRNQAQIYGIQVLSYYIPLIQPYMLRAGMQIIGANEEFVIIQGVIKGTKPNGELGNIYTDGMLVDTSMEDRKDECQRQSLCSSDERDTKMIKITKSSNDSRVIKSLQLLSKFQKDSQTKYRQIQKIINSDKSMKQCKQKLRKFEFFQSLSNFDLNQLITLSKLALLNKCSVVHNFGQEVKKIQFLLHGQIKVDNSVVHQRQKPVQPGKLIIQKYMVHKKQHSSSVVSFVQPGQWIGLQEYLWKQNEFLSKAEVVSHDAELFYIPVQVFQRKFNQLTCFFLINKLKGLIQTKKRLLDKTIKTKKQKQMQIMQQKNKSQAMQRFFEKMQKNNPRKTLNKFQTINTTQSKNIYKKSDLIKKREKFMSTRFPKQCYMPERLVHKVQVFQKKYISLPKIEQRLVLFPQQYQKAMIPLDLKQQLKFMKMMRQKNMKKQEKQHFRFLSPEKVYQTVIYASLSPKNQNPQNIAKKMLRTKSKASIEMSQLLQRAQKDDYFSQIIGSGSSTSRTHHFNQSIFNNFRAPKNKGQKLLKNISKTLQII